MIDNFFRYQHDRLGLLLRWGVGSSMLGPLLMLTGRPFWQQFGLQTFGWGFIDTLLAIAGRRRARVKAVQYEHGDLDEGAAQREAEQFRSLLLLNAGLDVLYIAGGLIVVASSGERAGRRGTGAGIAAQGLFLLIYDAALAADIDQRWMEQ